MDIQAEGAAEAEAQRQGTYTKSAGRPKREAESVKKLGKKGQMVGGFDCLADK